MTSAADNQDSPQLMFHQLTVGAYFVIGWNASLGGVQRLQHKVDSADFTTVAARQSDRWESWTLVHEGVGYGNMMRVTEIPKHEAEALLIRLAKEAL